MVETPEQRVEEEVGPEEVKDLGLQLRKNKDNADTALQLLKILDTKKITAELLIATLIGKALSSVNDTVEEGRDVEKLKELTKMKEHLKSKWKKTHAEYKKNKQK